MSWDQNYDNSAYGGDYENYGDFRQRGDHHQQQQQQQQQQYQQYQQQPQQGQQQYQGYDQGFDSYGGFGSQPQPQPQPQPQQPQQQHFYNPNEYAQQQQQQPQRQPQPQPQPQQSSYGGFGPPGAPPPTSSAPGQPQQPPGSFGLPGLGDQPLPGGVNPMVANMAMQYGQDIVGKGQEELKRNLDKYVSIGQLKYYFAVDNLYVGKKLGLLLFPFTHSDWSIKYSQDEPVQPKFDLNAPDLYIPSMAYVTYVLVVGYVLGIKNAFSPDQLATTASSALVWLVLELGCIYLTLTLMNITTNLCKWDVLSFSTYKYVGMIALLLVGLATPSAGRGSYYASLAYVSGALAFFLVRTLKLRIEPEVHGMQSHGKRKLYMILFYAGLQPLLIWWMTSHLLPVYSASLAPDPFAGGAAPDLVNGGAAAGAGANAFG